QCSAVPRCYRMVTRYLGPALFLGVALAGPATLAQSTTPTFIEGAAFSTGTKFPTATVTLTGAVARGYLLVGWFAQYGDPAAVRPRPSGRASSCSQPW